MTSAPRTLLLAASGIALVAGLLGAYAFKRAPSAEPDITVITHGDRVDLGEHAVAGKYTVFDFYAVWCPPCRALSPALEKLAAKNSEKLAIRKVDIVDWTMPVAEQYGIEELPHLVLFDKSGKRVADGDAVFDELGRLFGEDAADVSRVTQKSSSESM
jgi:thiol-disulfide isomerase/thioredoxin